MNTQKYPSLYLVFLFLAGSIACKDNPKHIKTNNGDSKQRDCSHYSEFNSDLFWFSSPDTLRKEDKRYFMKIVYLLNNPYLSLEDYGHVIGELSSCTHIIYGLFDISDSTIKNMPQDELAREIHYAFLVYKAYGNSKLFGVYLDEDNNEDLYFQNWVHEKYKNTSIYGGTVMVEYQEYYNACLAKFNDMYYRKLLYGELE